MRSIRSNGMRVAAADLLRAKVVAIVRMEVIDSAPASSSVIGHVRDRLVGTRQHLDAVKTKLWRDTVCCGYQKPPGEPVLRAVPNQDIAA
jgi:hypothetical protein